MVDTNEIRSEIESMFAAYYRVNAHTFQKMYAIAQVDGKSITYLDMLPEKIAKTIGQIDIAMV